MSLMFIWFVMPSFASGNFSRAAEQLDCAAHGRSTGMPGDYGLTCWYSFGFADTIAGSQHRIGSSSEAMAQAAFTVREVYESSRYG